MSSNDLQNPIALTARQQLAVIALMSGQSVEGAAKEAGVARRTLTRWLATAEFRASLWQAEADTLDTAGRRLLDRFEAAEGEVSRLMHGQQVVIDLTTGKPEIAGGVPPSVRLAAARTVLEFALRVRELRAVEERLAHLERLMEGLQGEG
jgi:AcrR family transcriptional regulator